LRRRSFGKPAASIAVLAILSGAVALATIAAAPPNLDRAIESQRRLAKERPQDAGVWNDLGNLLLLQGQGADAEAAYRRAVELDPKRTSALFNLGLLAQQQGRDPEATKLFKSVLEVDPRHAWAHYQLGSLHERRGEKQRAIQEYSEAFALDPQLGFPQVNPQVVESRLVTESMLRAYKKGMQSGTTASRQYDDPARITRLLVERPPASPEEAAKAAQDAAGRTTVLTPGSLPPSGTLNQATPPGQSKGTAPPRPGTPGAPNTYYNPNNNQYSVPGVGVPTPPAVQPGQLAQPGQQQWPRPQPRYINPMDPTQPGNALVPPPGGVYYRPGTPSTGQLSITVTSERG
jgi:tetratricopeptide (TPR) repeat protein